MTAFADSQVAYREIWGSFRLFVGGKDVTYFRDIPVQISGYQLTEPYGYGPADFALPQLSPFEAGAWGSGELSWMGNGKPVKLVKVDAGGSPVRVIWEGFISVTNPTVAGTILHCDGAASGKLAMRTKLPDLFSMPRHVGRKIFDAFGAVNLRVTPHLGGDIGTVMDGRGLSGSFLDYVDGLLAATLDTDGSQYTVMPNSNGTWGLALKDTTTVDFTVHLGAQGVEVDLSDDLTERPNTIYGQGVSPEGLIWVNGRYPGIIQGDPAPYPFTDHRTFGLGTTDADTDTGDGITVMLDKLVGMGYLPRTKKPGGYDADVVQAVKDLQDDAGLTQSGNMNVATWDALYDIGVTGYSLLQSYVHPLAQSSKVRKWNRTSNGSPASRNPAFDPSVVQVDLAVDHGSGVEKSQGKRYSRGVLARAQQAKNWAGTITLTSDVFAGNHAHSDVSPTAMSRLDITAGMNVKLRNFDGDTLFHVSVVQVSVNGDDIEVQLGVDTQARDAATLGQVIARRIESRAHPARQWLRQHYTGANIRQVEASEVFGILYNTVSLTGGEWNVFPVVAGQAGNVSRIRVQTSDDQAAFVVAITAMKTSPAFWRSKVGNPLSGVGLDDVFVSKAGSGYTSAPTVSFSGGGGSGAAATATVSGGSVISVDLTSAGSGYTAPPTVSFSGGGGSGAKAQAQITVDNKWTNAKIQTVIDDQRALLGAWGTPEQPCGYAPGRYTNDRGQRTSDSITGLMVEDAGFDYHTFGQPVLWIAVYPDRDCKIKPQRILWDVLESDA